MNEGWLDEDYLILFDDSELASVSDRYGISTLLPDYQVIGLRGWDDFILRDAYGRTYLVPTVPADLQHISEFSLTEGARALISDERYKGKIKWYIKPIVFGGDPKVGPNIQWVDHEPHGHLVRWWNDLYRSVKVQSGS